MGRDVGRGVWVGGGALHTNPEPEERIEKTVATAQGPRDKKLLHDIVSAVVGRLDGLPRDVLNWKEIRAGFQRILRFVFWGRRAARRSPHTKR